MNETRVQPLFAAAALVVLLGLSPAATAQNVEPRLETLFLKQTTDEATSLRLLTVAEQQELDDLFYDVVLREHADARDLDAIEELIQPNPSLRQTFVVSERILDPTRPQPRRAVLAYRGAHQGRPLEGTVMLSVGFSDTGFPARQPFIEAWGWDPQRRRYNYYKLDGDGLPQTATVPLQLWKFRGSSVDADQLTPTERELTCMQCHVNGGPIMKELAFPWNNWHSARFPITYLRSGFPGSWPVASDARLGNRLGPAEALETQFIAPAINRFNAARVESLLARREADGSVEVDEDGFSRVTDAPRLLKSLFFTTEINLGSADQPSSLFPLPAAAAAPGEPIVMPRTFFLNAHLIGRNNPVAITGLGLSEAASFTAVTLPSGSVPRPFTLSPAEYLGLVTESGQQVGQRPGDAGFAWFTPEPSHIDNSLIDELLDRGLVTPQFVAAVAAIDLETPILSEPRSRLIDFIPPSYRFRDLAGGAQAVCTDGPDDTEPSREKCHPDELTLEVISNLRAADPQPGTPEAEFLRRLESEDPVALLRQDVVAYRDRLAARLADPETRAAELRRLFDLLDERRRQVLEHEVFHVIDETRDRLLFPTRSGGP